MCACVSELENRISKAKLNILLMLSGARRLITLRMFKYFSVMSPHSLTGAS